MLKRLKKILNTKAGGGIDLSRRRFIGGAAALAALTVVPGLTPSLRVYEDFKKQLLSGVIENQTFYVDEPLIIDLSNVVIRNCRFVAIKPLEHILKVTESASHWVIEDCYFERAGLRIDAP